MEGLRRKIPFLAITLLVVALDRWTKKWIEGDFTLGESREVIAGFFDLVYRKNTGAAFGLFARPEAGETSWLLIAIGMLALVAVAVYFVVASPEATALLTALALVLGGAIGNLIDRLAQGAVTDFLEFYVGTYYWPAFNVADSAITVGIVLLAIDSFRSRDQ
ncbi:MAG: signal peptidase II [Acidobacteriota bacterium]